MTQLRATITCLLLAFSGTLGSFTVSLLVACSGTIDSEALDPNGGSVPNTGGGSDVRGPESGQRMTDRQFTNAVSDTFGIDVSKDLFLLPADSKIDGFQNTASGLGASAARTMGYLNLAQRVSDRVDWATYLSSSSLCSRLDGACPREVIDHFGRSLFRRNITDAEAERYLALFSLVHEEKQPFTDAVRLLVRAMLQAPEFLYRLEKAPGGKLEATAVANRLALLLWNSVPDETLIAAAESGALEGAGLRAQVERMLSDPKAKRALRDYVDDWLDVDRLMDVNRDPTVWKDFSPALALEMREEVHRLFERVAFTEDADLLEVFTTDKTSVTSALAKIYGAPAAAKSGFFDLDLAGDVNRIGLLTQPGILTATAVTGMGESIIDRGMFVIENLLCEELPAAPDDVPSVEPAGPGVTQRAQLLKHREDVACASCHAIIDPAGLALEKYDAFGYFRQTDAHGNTLDGTGEAYLGEQTVRFTNARQFVTALANSPELESCLAQKVLQYAFARPMGHDPLVAPMAAEFVAGGRRYRDYLAAIAQSPAYLTAPVEK